MLWWYMTIEVAFIIITALLTILAITGYDRYIATKVRAKTYSLIHNLSSCRETVGDNSLGADPETKMRIKKVKAVKVGSYLVVTLVIGEGGKGDEVEIDNPSLLMPLISIVDEESEEVTS